MAISKDKKKRLDGVMGKIKKKFGDDSINKLSDVADELRVTYHKTPSHEVNAMLGGGLGRGRIAELFGQPGCGKTSMALEQIAKEQQADEEFMAAWLETEGSLDPADCEMFGIDMQRLLIIEQSEDLPAEDAMDIVRSLVSSGEFNMIVVNSVAALMPKKEAEDDLEKQNIALTARLLSKFLRITTNQIAKNKCSLILINQVRTNLNSMYGGTVTSGGMAVAFYATQRIELKREKVDSGDPIDAETGIKVRCKVLKNRLAKGNPYKMCHYYAIYGKGIDSVSELGVVLAREGLITKKGSWLRLENEEGDLIKVPCANGVVEAKWNGNANFVNYLRENEPTKKYFEDMLNAHLDGGTFTGVSLSDEEIKAIEKAEAEIEKQIAATATEEAEEAVEA